MADDVAAVNVASEDERRLHELGYAQELRRRMSGFSNFAVSFTIISILSGCLTGFYFGMELGGPAIIVWGWPISSTQPAISEIRIDMTMPRGPLRAALCVSSVMCAEASYPVNVYWACSRPSCST